MSLRGQFFLSVVMALLLSFSVLAVVALGHARASVDNEMGMALEAGDRIVDNALLSLPRDGEDAYLQRLVKSFDGGGNIVPIDGGLCFLHNFNLGAPTAVICPHVIPLAAARFSVTSLRAQK